MTARCHRGVHCRAGLLACVVAVLFLASFAVASTNSVGTIAPPVHTDRSGLANLALQMVGQIQSQQQATLEAVQDSQQQNAKTVHASVIIGVVVGLLLTAGMLATVLYIRTALRSIQRRVRPIAPLPSTPPPASGTVQRLESLLDAGDALLELKQPGRALVCFDEALALDNHHIKAHLRRAAALEQQGRLDEALACYDHAIALDDSLADAYVGKGAIYNRLERYREALECYEQAAHLQPSINISTIHSLP